MADGWNINTGEAVYRTRDSIKNLRIKVRIERLTSAAVISQHLQQKVLTQQNRGDIELETLSSQGHAGVNPEIEELVVGWLEKLFSQYEMELFQNEEVLQSPLDRQYHAEIKALNLAKGRRNRRIFTCSDYDRYTNSLPLKQLVVGPTLLAERMANVRHRRQDRHNMWSKLITWEPTEEFVRSCHVVNNAMQTMYINADLGPPGRLGDKNNEYVLVTIKTDENGTVIVKPDFNKDKEPYRIVTEGDKREVWCLTVENVSKSMKTEEKDKESNMYKDLYVRHKDYLNSLIGQDFEVLPVGTLRYLMNGEITTAKGFEYDNLYIHFFVELPNNWSSLRSQSLSGVTQACRTKTLGKDNVAFFSYPFNFEAFFMSEKENEECILQWPVLYFKVLSLDSWQCYRTEGYGYLLFPATAGKHTVTCNTWRPLQSGTVSALRRFFIGGSPELEDHSYVRVPGTLKGERLSRFGFWTETTGSVAFTLHCIQQSRAFVDATLMKKRRQQVFDQLGGFSQQGAVCNILEAFQRARRKMQEARENLPRDLINTIKLDKNTSYF
uniref:MKS transition zone complex subunit 1 n=1 Tax=Sphaeramia orbicularis TaxID=375764 RepID=A0A672ZDL2_9TELE